MADKRMGKTDRMEPTIALETGIRIEEPAANRISALDSLRGIAALGVVATHCLQLALPDGTLNHTPLRILVNGRCFVIFFFVLSGFVLAKAIWQTKRGGYADYVKRRFARLMPPYLAAGLIGALIAASSSSLDWSALGSYMVALGTPQAIAVNPPSWSLVYELRASLLMPFIAALVAFSPARALALSILLFLVSEALIVVLHIGQFPYGADDWLSAATVTARFIVDFLAGALLAWDAQNKRHAIRIVAAYPLAALAVAYLLMSTLLDQFSLVAAVILIALALAWEPLRMFLEKAPFQWLGRISYSLYLTHYLVLTALVGLISKEVPTVIALLVVAPLTLVFAASFHEFVEKPAIAWSRRIGKSSKRKPAALAPE